jgi:ferredoxin/flavodoxin---NADP+ reductase
MQSEAQGNHLVAVIGAGPAGLYAAKQLTSEGAHVVMFNRDIKPGGLAEYGIYPDKHKMKDGLRNQFHQILTSPLLEYYGNVTVGAQGDISLEELRQMGFQALLVTAGAQGTKWLGLPGEDLRGVYHAKDLVYHYNRLPPFSQQPFAIGCRVAVIGVGNVMLDIAHYLASRLKVDEIIAVARRGPGEVKYDKKELEAVAAYLDMPAVEAEIERAAPTMRALGQDPAEPFAFIQSARVKAPPQEADTCFKVQFMASPVRILGGEDGRVNGLELEENTLLEVNGEIKARGMGRYHTLNVDSVIFAIGDCVDKGFGLPLNGTEFVRNPQPRFPVDELSYEAYDPLRGCALDDVFMAGWARQASTGLVGIARRDGTNGAKAVLAYLQSQPVLTHIDLSPLRERLAQFSRPVVDLTDLERLSEAERQYARETGLEEYKYSTNEEMLAVISRETSKG